MQNKERLVTTMLALMTCCLLEGSLFAAAPEEAKSWTDADYKEALVFFSQGGVLRVRLLEEVERKGEDKRVVLFLGSRSSLQNVKDGKLGRDSLSRYREGSVWGSAILNRQTTIKSAEKVLALSDVDARTWNEFFRRFAEGMQSGRLAAMFLSVREEEENLDELSVAAAVPLAEKELMKMAKRKSLPD